MNTLALQKQVNILEKAIKKASRVLLEFEVAQSRWDFEHGRYVACKSSKDVMRAIGRKLK